MSLPSMECFRETLAALGPDAPFCHAELYALFGAERGAVETRRALRRRCVGLVRQGELRRVGVGRYEVVADAIPRARADAYNRFWRAMTTAAPGWGLAEVALVAGVSTSHARRYLGWLLTEGYVARHGQRGSTALYRTTVSARERRTPAYPPVRATGGYQAERAAMARMARLFACANLYQPQIRESVAECARIILERFGKEEAHGRHAE